MLNIRELLEKRSRYSISKYEDEWVTKILRSDKEEEWLIVSSSFLFAQRIKSELNAITESFFVDGIYNLGSPFVDTAARFDLLHLTREEKESINISIFKGNMYDVPPRRKSTKDFTLADVHSLKYTSYLWNLERWINESIFPDSDENDEIEFNVVPIEGINWLNLYPEYYSKKALRVRELLEKEEIIRLGEYVDILIPKTSKEEVFGKTMIGRELRYPINYDCLPVKQATNVLIQKNDILFSSIGEAKAYLVADEVKEEVYASPYIYVIRCRDIQPEYLFLYLNSDVGRIIIESEKIGSYVRKVSLKTLREIPVIRPKKDWQVYSEQAYLLTHSEKSYTENKAEQLKRLSKSYSVEQEESIEDILSIENAKKIKLFDEEKVRGLLDNDLEELKNCFKVGAYKATLILAGSILEAVLIDWLSDIKGINYFENDYFITKRDGKTKKADLVDYIKAIEYIERPNWMEEANKAHEIRKKRNLVHAKLCLKSDDINENVCRQVIEYLNDVLKTRGVN